MITGNGFPASSAARQWQQAAKDGAPSDNWYTEAEEGQERPDKCIDREQLEGLLDGKQFVWTEGSTTSQCHCSRPDVAVNAASVGIDANGSWLRSVVFFDSILFVDAGEWRDPPWGRRAVGAFRVGQAVRALRVVCSVGTAACPGHVHVVVHRAGSAVLSPELFARYREQVRFDIYGCPGCSKC